MLLAIETATDLGSVALLDGETVVAEQELGEARHHTASLLPAIDGLLRERGLEVEALGSIALSIGPGSFTGLRVGLATALGLCFGTEREIVPVPTLAALSLHAEGYDRISPLLDARKGQVYAGAYGPRAQVLVPDRVTDPGAWLEALRGSGPVALLGAGADLYADAIRAALGPDAVLLGADAGRPRASTVGRLARGLVAVPPAEVRLRYLRPPEAEAQRRDSGSTAPHREDDGG